LKSNNLSHFASPAFSLQRRLFQSSPSNDKRKGPAQPTLSPCGDSAPALPDYLIRARQHFFLQAVQHAFDCRHAFVELLNLEESRERKKSSREQTSHRCQNSEKTVQPAEEKQAAKIPPPWAQLKDIKK